MIPACGHAAVAMKPWDVVLSPSFRFICTCGRARARHHHPRTQARSNGILRPPRAPSLDASLACRHPHRKHPRPRFAETRPSEGSRSALCNTTPTNRTQRARATSSAA